MQNIKQISVTDLKAKLDNKDNFILVDVREQDEYETARIEGATLIPLSQFPARAPKELKQDQSIVIHCHHGGRSQRACMLLASMGYKDVSNVAGGIDAWSLEIDPSVARY
ncbi:rhodanese [bacterium]|nr:rhodanese [bacterium]